MPAERLAEYTFYPMDDLVRPRAYRGTVHTLDAPTLEMQNVYVAYAAGGNGATVNKAEQYALQAVSFQAEVGEQIAVVGPNGAGKSTLFKLIVGTIKPSRGTVQLYGHSPDKHICIAYVPQRSQIDWSFPATVEDVVMMGRVGRIGLFRRPKKQDWELVRASLDRVNANHLARKQIGELSGGQQQRVFIARALAQEAELLLLDEPLSGLDLPSQQAIFKVLESLRPDGVTVLLATHDLTLAAERFDRVMLLNRRLVAFDRGPSVLTAENLLAAYGGHMHRIDEEGAMLLADTCCDHDEPH
ncbi:MAG: metal ABC transporter ATP-binding protein [Chloroflexota bacterium]|nr:metal ABC transporter ATP-binding protein [Chloroflexota bacterium]